MECQILLKCWEVRDWLQMRNIFPWGDQINLLSMFSLSSPFPPPLPAQETTNRQQIRIAEIHGTKGKAFSGVVFMGLTNERGSLYITKRKPVSAHLQRQTVPGETRASGALFRTGSRGKRGQGRCLEWRVTSVSKNFKPILIF